MIPQLLIHPKLEIRSNEAEKLLAKFNLSKNHPNLLWIEDEKLGIEQARKIKEHLNLKPYQDASAGIVILNADKLTIDAQNALLKILEEPSVEAVIILTAPSDQQFLPTLLSRCQVINLNSASDDEVTSKYTKDIEKLAASSIEDRFVYIEKSKAREEFFKALIFYYREQLIKNPSKDLSQFTKELIQAEKWSEQNVNLRAILEYLMLILPITQ